MNGERYGTEMSFHVPHERGTTVHVYVGLTHSGGAVIETTLLADTAKQEPIGW